MPQTSTYELIKKKLQAISDQRTKGGMFEILSKHLLRENDTAGDYEYIKLWNDWELRGNESDCGIDIVIKTTLGEFIAVQCKFYEGKIVSLNNLSTFLTKLQSGVGDVRFKRGIIISTSNLSSKAQSEIEQVSKSIPIDIISEEDFINSSIDWVKLDPTQTQGELPLQSKKKPRAHQEEAINAVKEYFSTPNHTRGKLIMACGTGKTYTSLKIIESLEPKPHIVLFLAPSIALVSQTFREYCAQRSEPFVASIVCSDSKSGQSEDDISFSELPIAPSTRTEDIIKAYERAKRENRRFIIFSTYQSALRIKEAQNHGLGEIDLMICDEAHRSVGAMYSLSKSDREAMLGDMGDEAYNSFTICHSNEHIKAKKRLYMTATPKVYKDNAKAKAQESDNFVFSMDDTDTFGGEIYSLNFDQAIRQNLLTDYKVIILALKTENLSSVANNAISKLKAEGTKLHGKMIDNEFVCKIIGTHKGLAKQDLITLDSQNQQDNDFKNEFDKALSRRAISFCRNIKTSQNITSSFKTIIDCYNEEMKRKSFKNLDISIDHIDGTMNSKIRLDKLTELNNPKEKTCNVLSNARCLSEGIDVPALDSIVFFDGRSAIVDIIQAVGRVMRKAEGKEMGYIILPIALSESEINDLDKAVNNTNFQNIWRVLKSLRSHDPSLVDEAVFKEKIKIVLSDDTPLTTDPSKKDKKEGTENEQEKKQIQTLFDVTTLNALADAVYNVMPTKLGDKGYWESFSAKTAKIAETLNMRLRAIFAKKPLILKDFLSSLRENIHQYIEEDEAIDMICSHIITKPIFDVIFGESVENPIGKALDKVLEKVSELGLEEEETKYLDKLYTSVRENANYAVSQKSKQELIKNLYDTFLRTAFKKQSEKLGIVYTPIEVVDFILRATNDILKKHFNTNYNDPSVKVFDPFTGTGSFITRLLAEDNNLISQEALKDKFENGLFAQDIVLLSYYIALINITQTAQSRDSSLGNFKNIALTDSLDYLEEKSNSGVLPAFEDLEGNKKIKNAIDNQRIRVIVGNPPYSGGANSQNDNNANLSHPNLEKRVFETYSKRSTANLAKNTRDTLIQAIRMASDRLEDKGVLGFVVNGGFLDATSADGFRKCLVEEFAHIYVLNLRGNQRTSGEESRKEGGKIFGGGSRASVAIILLIKDSSIAKNTIHYYDIGDYLSREDKLNKIGEFAGLDSVEFSVIVPNGKGDWINQRDEEFEKLIPLKREGKKSESIFDINATGVVSGRDSWAYNFSQDTLMQSMQKCIDTYNADLERFNQEFREGFKKRTAGIASTHLYKYLNDKEITTDPTQISWTERLKNSLIKNESLSNADKKLLKLASYRPFNKQWIYWDKTWNERQSQFPRFFPEKNLTINTSLMASRSFSCLIADEITDFQTMANNQAYPLYYYDELGTRHSAISGYALNLFHTHYKDSSITEEEIFYYIYAIFHHKGYLSKYSNSLSKEAPRIALSKDFKELSKLGKTLAELHLNYESGEMHASVEHKEGMLADTEAEGYYDVVKMVRKDTTIAYNKNISITNIPLKALSYQVNGKSAIDWVIERYQVIQNKDSLIKNNPNDYAGGKYVFELICRIIKLSEKSVDLIEEISGKEFE